MVDDEAMGRVEGCAGGGLDSSEAAMDGGRASTADRYPELMKVAWVWAAWRFVRMSLCSSEFCDRSEK
jgi:hypothetical protein